MSASCDDIHDGNVVTRVNYNTCEGADVIDLTMVDDSLSPPKEGYNVNRDSEIIRRGTYGAYRPYSDDYSVDSFGNLVDENEKINEAHSFGIIATENGKINNDAATDSPSSMSSVSIDKAFYESPEERRRNEQLPSIEEVRNMSIMMLKNAQNKSGRRNKFLSKEDIRKMSAVLMKKRRKEEQRKRWKNKWSEWKNDFFNFRKGKLIVQTMIIVFLLLTITLCIIAIVNTTTYSESKGTTSKSKDVLKSIDQSYVTKQESSSNISSRMSDVMDFLSKYSDRNALRTLGTPQNLAAKWIANTDKQQLQIEESERFLQRYALAVFFFATGGPTYWPQKLGFLSPSDECFWFNLGHANVDTEIEVGASCLGTDQVRQLVLPPETLQGAIPDELKLLSSLEHISIFSNPRISGPFPESLKKMSNLNHLLMDSCAFEEKIPTWIGNLHSLKTLRLSNNGFIGSLPYEISNLKQLKTLMLDDNNLLGSANVFETLPKLKVLSAKNNMLHGVMGTTFFDALKYLKVLDLSMNQINSTLPNNMFNNEELLILNLGYNKLHGTIPSVGMDDQPYKGKLEFLALNNNLLTGELPSSISKIKSLTNLDVSNNMLSARLPEQLKLLTNLNYILLEENSFVEDDSGLATILENLKSLRGAGVP